jgi:DNA-binding NarL/FixJ family response regulator
MDLSMPELDGLAATRLILAEQPDARVVILTASEEDADLFEAIKSGAQGYLFKNVQSDELVQALEGVARGERTTPAPAKLLGEFAKPAAARAAQPSRATKR